MTANTLKSRAREVMGRILAANFDEAESILTAFTTKEVGQVLTDLEAELESFAGELTPGGTAACAVRAVKNIVTERKDREQSNDC